MVTDEMIDQALTRLDRFGRKTPLEGKWQTAPYVDTPYEDESAAVIKVDSVFLLGVGRTSGRVVLIGDCCTEDTLVNSSVEAFAACAEAMWDGTRNPPDDNDDDALEAAARELRKKMEPLDPPAFTSENQLWPCAIAEFGYGI